MAAVIPKERLAVIRLGPQLPVHTCTITKPANQSKKESKVIVQAAVDSLLHASAVHEELAILPHMYMLG